MNVYANQRVLTRFAVFELCISIFAVSFFSWVRRVTDLPELETQWRIFNLAMVYRITYGLVGLHSAFNRKQRFTWAFSCMMAINSLIMLTAILDLSGFSCIRVPSITMQAPWENHHEHTTSTNEALLLLSYFDIPNPRIYFRSGPSAPQPKCDVMDRTDTSDIYAVRSSMQAIRERQSPRNPGTPEPNGMTDEELQKREEGLWTSSPLLLDLMDQYLRKCMARSDCGVVEVRLQRDESDEPSNLQICTYPLSVVPYVDHTFACTARRAETAPRGCVLPDISVFFWKDVARSATKVLAFDEIVDEQEVVCHLSRDILIGIICLDIASTGFMFVIVLKFATNRCGDHFDTEVQFNVEFSSDEEDSYDDLSWVHSQANLSMPVAALRKSMKKRQSRGSVVKRRTRKSLAVQLPSSNAQEIEMSNQVKKSEAQQVGKAVTFAHESSNDGVDSPRSYFSDSCTESGSLAPSSWGFRLM